MDPAARRPAGTLRPAGVRRLVARTAATGLAMVALAAAALRGAVADALAASPAPTAGDVGDPRSSGQGPGLVGDPMTAVLLVVVIAVLAVAATLAYVRATGGSRESSGGR